MLAMRKRLDRDRQDAQIISLSALTALMYNVFAGQKGGKVWKPEDFLPQSPTAKPDPPQSWKTQRDMMMAMCEMWPKNAPKTGHHRAEVAV